MKPLTFMGSSLDDIRAFPKDVKRAVGFELDAIQRGLTPSDWKPIATIGGGAMEMRIHMLGEWRVLYVARFANAIFVLHAFQKKTRKIRRDDLELACQRYKEIEIR